MLDVHLRLFYERLKRVLAGEEGTLALPDSTKLTPLFQNLFTETEIVTTLLGNYEGDMAHCLIQLFKEDVVENVEISSPLLQLLELEESDEDVKRPDIWEILEDINYFVHESEEAIDTFFINIMQPNSERESESSTCKALLVELHSKIIDIRNRMQQLPPSGNDFDISEQRDKLINFLIEGQPRLDIKEFERGREELFDLLIEGPLGLSVVAILDSSGFDKTAFAADTYNNNHVKFYFDCHAWVRVSALYDFGNILDDIIKSVMPPSRVSVIIGEDYKLKKTILRDYLTNKKYFIFLDDVFHYSEIWGDLEEVLPDDQNGSRVLITVTDPYLLISFDLENGEKIRLDSVLVGGPLLRIKYEAWQFFIVHYGSTPLEYYVNENAFMTFFSRICSVLELPFHLKVCCIYLCVFGPSIEISTRQLYLLWVAEGLIPYNSEEAAEHYLEVLIDRGFIQVSKKRAGGTIKACYVTSSLFVTLIWAAGKTGFVKKPKMKVKSLADAKRYFILIDEFISFEHSDMHLQSFLNHSSKSDELDLIDCENLCKKFKHLRVLNMGSAVLDQYPHGLENLFYLKYLKLNIPSLKCLPSLLCTLLNLQTLEMPSSYIDHSPQDIWMMQKLMHLNFGSITLPAPPKNYSSSLKHLIFISALHPGSCTPDILSKVPNVQTLRICGDLSYYHSGVSKSLCELHKLECLKLVHTKMGQLSRMVLSEYQFPPSLTQLSLSNTELMEDPMPTLEKLPHLQVLKLKQNSYSGRKLACVGSGGFPQLKILHLKSMLWLDEWTMGSGVMPKLGSLMVNPCAYLRKLPDELYNIESLCKLELHWPQPELRQRLRAFDDIEWRYDIQIYPYGI